MSDISNIAVSSQNIVVAINNLTKIIQNLSFTAPSATSASLPTPSAAGQGSIRFVTDATSTTRLAIYSGGGTLKVLIFSDGVNWLVL
jgi:hypothetical protein